MSCEPSFPLTRLGYSKCPSWTCHANTNILCFIAEDRVERLKNGEYDPQNIRVVKNGVKGVIVHQI